MELPTLPLLAPRLCATFLEASFHTLFVTSGPGENNDGLPIPTVVDCLNFITFRDNLVVQHFLPEDPDQKAAEKSPTWCALNARMVAQSCHQRMMFQIKEELTTGEEKLLETLKNWRDQADYMFFLLNISVVDILKQVKHPPGKGRLTTPNLTALTTEITELFTACVGAVFTTNATAHVGADWSYHRHIIEILLRQLREKWPFQRPALEFTTIEELARPWNEARLRNEEHEKVYEAAKKVFYHASVAKDLAKEALEKLREEGRIISREWNRQRTLTGNLCISPEVLEGVVKFQADVGSGAAECLARVAARSKQQEKVGQLTTAQYMGIAPE